MKESLSTPPENTSKSKRKVRNSNLELYRIIVMLLIVGHHYVVNSGLLQVIGDNPDSPSAIPMLIFGAWGKTGINCFVLITGYFMCRTKYTLQKLLKLYLQILFYSLLIYLIFLLTGSESISIKSFIRLILPIKDLTTNSFTSCFLAFYLFIPFLNILINGLDKQQHGRLTILSLVCYSVLPTFRISLPLNYIGWFIIIYLVSSYVYFYRLPFKWNHIIWGFISLGCIIMSAMSIICMTYLYRHNYLHDINHVYYFVSDSNKILAFATAFSSFMFFKDLKIPYQKWINIIGATTFGVFLIHTHSNTMREWLWSETVKCTEHFRDEIIWTLGYAIISVVVIFIVCSGIDWFRSSCIEPHIQKVFDRIKLSKVVNTK